MSLKINQETILDGATVEQGEEPIGNYAAGIGTSWKQTGPNKLRVDLTGVVVSIDSGDDFGSVKLCDLPNKNLRVLQAVVDLAVTVAGLAVNTAAALDVAVGTVATTSVDFTNAGEDDVTPKIDGVGAAATGTVDGIGDATTQATIIAAGASNEIHLNAASAVTAGTGTATFTGFIEITLLDFGVAGS